MYLLLSSTCVVVSNFVLRLASINVLALPNRTDCTFSPDDKLVVTGISVRKDEGKGKILFMDRETLDTVYQIEGSSSVRKH